MMWWNWTLAYLEQSCRSLKQDMLELELWSKLIDSLKVARRSPMTVHQSRTTISEQVWGVPSLTSLDPPFMWLQLSTRLPSASHVMSRCDLLTKVKCWRNFSPIIQSSWMVREQSHSHSCLLFTITWYSITWIFWDFHWSLVEYS